MLLLIITVQCGPATEQLRDGDVRTPSLWGNVRDEGDVADEAEPAGL